MHANIPNTMLPRTSLPILPQHPHHLLPSYYLIPSHLSLSLSLYIQPPLHCIHFITMMGSLCADQQHKLHPLSFLTKKSLREIDIPPRKLLIRRPSAADSPKMDADNSVFSKFLPYNDVDDDDSDPYSSDHFRMYEFKVRKCNRSRSHDWTDCPFAHPGEKARRRDPRRYHYSGTVCSEFRKGHCGKGDNCEFSHGVFECWLHPSRYRTEACKDGKNCKRKVCFFAHSSRQLRIVSDTTPSPPLNSPTAAEKCRGCCLYCHSSMTASPTSTLMGHMSHSHNMSPPLSPPISPVCSPEFSHYGSSRFGSVESCSLSDYERELTYKDALTELMASFEAMNANESPTSGGRLPWLDVNFNVEEQPQFVLSPTPPPASRGRSKLYGGESKYTLGGISGRNLMDDSRFINNEGSSGGPDLGWVNDLLT